MARFFLTTFGSAGDVFPMLGLAIALQRRGHEVVLATNAHFESAAIQYGVPFQALGTEAEFLRVLNNPDLWHPFRAFGAVFHSLAPYLRIQYDMIEQWMRGGDELVIANCLSFGARIAQEKLRAPLITVHLQPAVLWSDVEPPHLPGLRGPRWFKRFLFRLGEKWVIDRTALRTLHPWRAGLGLPPMRQLTRWWNSPMGILCLFPDWYAPPQPDWPPNLKQTDFPLWNRGSELEPTDELNTFLNAGSPPIVFTPGSANQHGKDFFQVAALACRQLGRRAIFLSVFEEHLPVELGNDIAHFRYVPLDRLLPRAAAFVHHGGIGSTSQAILAGVPQILMPLAHDQFDNANRIVQLGLGRAIPAPQFTQRRLVFALQQVLKSQEISGNCREFASRLAPHQGLARGAEWIESRVPSGK